MAKDGDEDEDDDNDIIASSQIVGISLLLLNASGIMAFFHIENLAYDTSPINCSVGPGWS